MSGRQINLDEPSPRPMPAEPGKERTFTRYLPSRGTRYHRKVLRIRAEDSPNVRYGMAEIAAGLKPSNKIIIPGVLPYSDYAHRRATWDKIRQRIGLDGLFYEGGEVLMFPPDWLNASERAADELVLHNTPRIAKGIGVDPAEGGDHTAMCAVDEWGVVDLVSVKTPDTSVIRRMMISFMAKHGVPADRVCIDRGGGGKEHADYLRADHGLSVRTVAFGEAADLGFQRARLQFQHRVHQAEQKGEYKNRRAQLYGELRSRLDPSLNEKPFAIPKRYQELRRQLSPIPLLYDSEGRLYMLPKRKSTPTSQQPSLTDLIGCSPDEVDAMVLGLFAMSHKSVRPKAGAL